MALVKCIECGNSVSDKANSCPKCGCPIADVQYNNYKINPAAETTCPHCKTLIDNSARVCKGCGAVKGYLYSRTSGVQGIFTVLAGLIGALLLTFALITDRSFMQKDGSGVVILLPMSVVVWLVWKLFRGPYWFR